MLFSLVLYCRTGEQALNTSTDWQLVKYGIVKIRGLFVNDRSRIRRSSAIPIIKPPNKKNTQTPNQKNHAYYIYL